MKSNLIDSNHKFFVLLEPINPKIGISHNVKYAKMTISDISELFKGIVEHNKISPKKYKFFAYAISALGHGTIFSLYTLKKKQITFCFSILVSDDSEEVIVDILANIIMDSGFKIVDPPKNIAKLLDPYSDNITALKKKKPNNYH